MSDPNGWQDIETAPRDGTEFLAYGCYIYPGDSGPTEYRKIAAYSGNEEWPWEDDDGQSRAEVFTHWQPLPDPPDPEYWSRRKALKDKKVDIE